MAALRVLTAAGALVASLSIPTAAQNNPSLASLLERGAGYVAAYAPRVSGVILEEQYMLVEIARHDDGPAAHRLGCRPDQRQRADDGAARHLRGGHEAGARAHAANQHPAGRRRRRPGGSWRSSTRNSRSHYFRAEIVLHASEPTLAPHFSTSEPAEVTYRLDGQKKMNGVAVAGIRFQEPVARDKQYMLGTRGNAAASDASGSTPRPARSTRPSCGWSRRRRRRESR